MKDLHGKFCSVLPGFSSWKFSCWFSPCFFVLSAWWAFVLTVFWIEKRNYMKETWYNKSNNQDVLVFTAVIIRTWRTPPSSNLAVFFIGQVRLWPCIMSPTPLSSFWCICMSYCPIHPFTSWFCDIRYVDKNEFLLGSWFFSIQLPH